MALEAMMDAVNERVRVLKALTVLTEAEDWDGWQTQLGAIDGEVQSLEYQFAQMRRYVAEESASLARAAELQHAIAAQHAYLTQHVLHNLPARLPGMQQQHAGQQHAPQQQQQRPQSAAAAKSKTKASAENSVNASTTDEHAGRPATAGARTRSNKPAAQTGAAPANTSAASAPAAPRIPTAPAYVTVSELDRVPGYARGRVTLDRMNEAIDEIAAALRDKYTLMAVPSSKLAGPNAARVRAWKQQECDETRGRVFFTLQDVAHTGGTLAGGDQTSKAVLQVLRHCGRVHEVRAQGTTLFVLGSASWSGSVRA